MTGIGLITLKATVAILAALMAGCVLLLSDSPPNGVLRIRR